MRYHRSLTFLLVLSALASPALADDLPVLTAALYAADESAAAGDEPYRAGREALDEGRWAEAADLFAESAGSGSGHADAASYWQAYALNKAGRSADALETLAKLRQTYEGSSWLDDARALEIEIQGRAGRTTRRTARNDRDRAPTGRSRAGNGSLNESEELKLLALNSLMHSDSERALPMLEKFLAGDHALELRERALFVLSQSDSAEAARILLAVARGDQHPELQMRAVRYLGLSDVPAAATALGEIYRSTSDKQVKASVLHGFMVSDAEEPLLEIARSEPDSELRRNAIHQLGVMDARDALRSLYESESSPEVKQEILHSLFIADDDETLVAVARSESDEGLRRSAISSLGLVGSDAARAALTAIYDESSDAETKAAIIEALFLSGDAMELIRIARAESDPDLRQEAFRRLSLMDDDAAVDFMMEILERP